MSKKKTHEEYVAELKIKNPNVEVVGEYVDAKTKIMHHCLLHDVYWEMVSGNALKGKGCKECMKEKNRNHFIKSHDEYVSQLKEVNPNIIVLEQYMGNDIPVLHFCITHNIKWKAYPSNVLKGQGCVECGKEKFHDKRCKKHDDYVKELKLINSDIEVVEEYVGGRTPITHRCLKHNIIWKMTPSDALRGGGCWECRNEKMSKLMLKSHEEYVNELLIKNQNVEVIGKYVNSTTKTMHRCLKHDVYWEALPNNVLKGCGCPKCLSEKISNANLKTHEEYIEELKNINPDIMVIGHYINARTPILHKCLIDGYEWSAVPYVLLCGYGCPQCSESSGERFIRQFLQSYDILYEYQKSFKDCRDINPLPFDFYLPDYNILIEYDGIQHFEPVDYFGGQQHFEYVVKHDKIKNDYCKNKNIKLLRIPYFKNIEEELNNFLFI